MVMKRNMMHKNLTQTIVQSLGRYIAIVAIIALGCALFVGLKVTKTDMIATGQEYTDSQNMFDLRLLNSYGWTQEQVDEMAKLSGIDDAEGSIYLDAFASVENGEESVYRLHSIPEKVNKPYLLGGRMPLSDDECLVDGDYFGENVLGKQIVVSETNDADTLDGLHYRTYTIVGYVSTPLYMDMTRGSTALGSGTLFTYIYLPKEAFAVDYFTEVYVTVEGDWVNYSEVYDDMLEDMSQRLKEDISPLAQQRFVQLLADAEKAYADGLTEYEEGLNEYESGREEALRALEDALQELLDAQKEIDDGWASLAEGEAELADAQKQLEEGRKKLDASVLELEYAKAEAYQQMAAAYTELLENYKLVSESMTQVNEGLVQIDDGIAQIDDGLTQIEDNLPLLKLMVSLMESTVKTTEKALQAAEQTGNTELAQALAEELEEHTETLAEYQSQLDLAEQTQLELETTRAGLIDQRAELVETKEILEDALEAIDLGFVELETNENVANNRFAAAEAQINAGYLELDAGQAELDAGKAELDAGKAELTDGQAQLEKGWAEYESGKAEAEAELADAEAQLADAQAELKDAREAIDSMTEPDVFALSRNTNAGYLAVDSNSSIVSGIARVLPVFFLLIAALVCITTMTRMVEEERTQIGTLKALGYSNAAIMGKYILYSASASIIGCAVGVAVGSTFFPILLWNAYGIILNIRPNVALVLDWKLCLGVSLGYIAVSSLVTWYCCRRTLREVPAELIRPKAPEAGKKIFLEFFPFWKKLSFLNKVMLRNVFRYRQRFLMMLIGIGGCTALLLTGFGLVDTVVDIANIQFEKVNHFDIEVYFSEGLNEEEKQAFLEDMKGERIASQAGFFYQASVELDYDSNIRDVYLISAEDSIRDYLSFTWDGEDLGMPGKNEAFLSVGVTELLGIGLGDTVTVRNSDMETMTLTVAGIYENHVYNYVIVSPETAAAQWGYTPADQMAFIQIREGVDVHEAGTAISAMDKVINITVCEDSAEMVTNMMDALNLVLVVVILSAGLLGAIVLYNLTNININERIREIATIKVLGFNAGETSAYVFKENILLTVLGTGFGLILGKIFLEFVMENIKVSFVWFKTRLTVPSYIYAVLLTLLCAVVVDFIFHHKLDKINMAEALKSVE